MKVFVIDNSMMTLEWIAEIALYIEGLEVIGITDKADDGIEKIKELEPDMVILNYNLFQINFNGVIKNIRKIKPGIRIAAVHNDISPEFKDMCMNLGIDYFSLKTRDHYEKIHEVLFNIAITNKLQREWYNFSLKNLTI